MGSNKCNTQSLLYRNSQSSQRRKLYTITPNGGNLFFTEWEEKIAV